ncbi:MAG: 7-carboxy-7-deazaguanine synthase [Oceanospirillaceae bacterium]|nr:7-carboxy-7-deazaguanine synthase [Oceanospirillaceae bacterium]MCP5336081.1 7-carboxy-7-deazaguanine synthase [Oceanospirillaceae bacterium]
MAKAYRVKEAFYSLQGEGAQLGRPAVFCRFAKCNLWNGREEDRATSVCNFCDTDITGTDGQNGGIFSDANALGQHLLNLWPNGLGHQYVVFTGGEPLLQLDETLIKHMQSLGFEVAVETNGTLPLPAGLDWVCVSPKGASTVVVTHCNELKLVFPQADCPPENVAHITADYYYLSPMANPADGSDKDIIKASNTRSALQFCLQNPKWRLTLQAHKHWCID